MNVILTIFPPENRGALMGMIGLAIIFAPAIGPVIAGFILVSYAWEMMFYGMIPITLIVIVCGLIYLRNVSERSDTNLIFSASSFLPSSKRV
jgi:MFS family permease